MARFFDAVTCPIHRPVPDRVIEFALSATQVIETSVQERSHDQVNKTRGSHYRLLFSRIIQVLKLVKGHNLLPFSRL
jgi:hypothetical protein